MTLEKGAVAAGGVVVTGPPAAGMSTVGRALADELGGVFVSLDAVKEDLLAASDGTLTGWPLRQAAELRLGEAISDAVERGRMPVVDIWAQPGRDDIRVSALLRERPPLMVEVMCVVAEDAAVERFFARAQGGPHEARELPDVILMDIRMPVMNGIEATELIAREFPACPVVALTTYDQDDYAFAMLAAGAVGFFLKDTTAPKLHETLRAVHAGQAILTPRVTKELLLRSPAALVSTDQQQAQRRVSSLAPREYAVASLVALGLTNAEIAARLNIQPDSVKKAVTRTLAKLALHDRVQLAIVMRDAPPRS